MKKLNIRITMFLLLMSLTAAIFQGCSAGMQKEHEYASPDLDAMKEKKDTTLVIYSYAYQAAKPTNAENILAEAQKRSWDTLKAKLDFRWIDSNGYAEKIKSMINSGENFDAFLSNGISPVNYAIDDLSLDITRLFPQYAPKYYKKFTRDDLMSVSLNGKIFGIPRSMPLNYRMCAIVRQDIIDKYKLPGIRTYEDLEKYMEIMKSEESSRSPVSLSFNTKMLFAEAFGYVNLGADLVYRWDDPDMKVMAWELTPEFSSMIDAMKRWQANGYIRLPSTIAYSPQRSYILINFASLNSVLPGVNFGSPTRVYALYPDKMTSKQSPASYSIILNKNANNPERAIEFVEWVESDQENYDLMLYGIKDTNYALVDDKVSYVMVSTGKKHYGWSGYFAFENMDLFRQNIMDPIGYKEWYKSNATLKTGYAPHSSLVDYTDLDEKTKLAIENLNKVLTTGEIADIIKKRNDSANRFENDLRSGKEDLSVNAYINEQRSIGTDKVVQAYQSVMKELMTLRK